MVEIDWTFKETPDEQEFVELMEDIAEEIGDSKHVKLIVYDDKG